MYVYQLTARMKAVGVGHITVKGHQRPTARLCTFWESQSVPYAHKGFTTIMDAYEDLQQDGASMVVPYANLRFA